MLANFTNDNFFDTNNSALSSFDMYNDSEMHPWEYVPLPPEVFLRSLSSTKNKKQIKFFMASALYAIINSIKSIFYKCLYGVVHVDKPIGCNEILNDQNKLLSDVKFKLNANFLRAKSRIYEIYHRQNLPFNKKLNEYHITLIDYFISNNKTLMENSAYIALTNLTVFR